MPALLRLVICSSPKQQAIELKVSLHRGASYVYNMAAL